MPQTSSKNMPISPAASALGVGLGDQLAQQADQEEEENRRRMLTDQGVGLSASATTLLGPMS